MNNEREAGGAEPAPDVLLVQMPFALELYPSPALGILKARLVEAGASCSVWYGNLAFRRLMGADGYDLLAGLRLPANYPFARVLHGDAFKVRDRDAVEYFRSEHDLDDCGCEALARASSCAEEFIARSAVRWAFGPRSIAGFSVNDSQMTASLALARRIKKLFPNTTVVFGGANCRSVLGPPLLEFFPWVDYVFTGEADETFPEFVRLHSAGRDVRGISGLAFRGREKVRSNPQPPASDLNSLPLPDYEDFLEALAEYDPARLKNKAIVLEGSRGCWWGDRSKCLFCGFCAEGSAYRQKSPDKILEELNAASERYSPELVAWSDTLFPSLDDGVWARFGEMSRDKIVWLETKANSNRRQLRRFKEAGIVPFFGIEQLSPRLLALLRKGVTLLQCVQILKWSRDLDLQSSWNMMFGIPGETPEDYEQAAEVVRLLFHLEPPASFHKLRMERWSPLHTEHASFGIDAPRPAGAYGLLHPFTEEQLSRLAVVYEMARNGQPLPLEHAVPLRKLVREWREAAQSEARPLLVHRRVSDREVVLYDSRPGRTSGKAGTVTRLEGLEARVHLECDALKSPESLCRRLELDAEGERRLPEVLTRLEERGFVLADGDRRLALSNDLEELKLHDRSERVWLVDRFLS